MIEIGAVTLGGGRITGRTFHSFVGLADRIPADGTAVHGITDKDIAGAPPFTAYDPCRTFELVSLNVRNWPNHLRTLTAAAAEAYFFVADFLVIQHAALVIEAANALRLPTMATELGAVRTGALAGYGPDFREYGRRPAGYVARILAGTLPRDVPVEAVDQPALAINLKTAKAIGLDIPPLLLTRADEVIE